MKNYLYLLKFKNERLIKIGIAKDLKNRINILCRHYQFDLIESYSVTFTEKGLIRPLEDLFKVTYRQYKPKENKYVACDGFSEILNVQCLPLIIRDLKQLQKKDWLGIKIEKGIKIDKLKLNPTNTKSSFKEVNKPIVKLDENYLKSLHLIYTKKKDLSYLENLPYFVVFSKNEKLLKEIMEKSTFNYHHHDNEYIEDIFTVFDYNRETKFGGIALLKFRDCSNQKFRNVKNSFYNAIKELDQVDKLSLNRTSFTEGFLETIIRTPWDKIYDTTLFTKI